MKTNSTKNVHPEFAFKRGFMQVAQGDAATVKSEIMTALNIKSRASWLSRLNGKVEPRMTEITAINGIFSRYGIKDVWGN